MEVKIEKLVYGGEGLGHAEGAAVFVPFVLPDETVSIVPIERKRKFVRGRLERLLTASPARVAPPCPYFHSCGGCNYQHIPYEAQLRYKVEILRETFRRLGHMDWDGPIQAHASPAWAYRNRAQWKIRVPQKDARLEHAAGPRDDRETETHGFGIGYFRAGSTALVPVAECAITSPLLQRTLQRLHEIVLAGALPLSLREMEAFTNAEDERLLITASFRALPTDAGGWAAQFRTIVPEIESILFQDVAQEQMELFGPGFLVYRASGYSYRVGHMSFFQVNRFLLAELIETVVGNSSGSLALDLFCGVGLFTLPLAAHFERVIAVESNPASVRDLASNAAMNRAEIESNNSEVHEFLRGFRGAPELVVLDPPRAGVSAESLARISRLLPSRITYVSCDPSTLARDAALLARNGYEVSEIHLFDLFPQTFHIETVTKLTLRT